MLNVIKLPEKKRKNYNFGRKGILQVLGNNGSGYHQISGE